jgi:hypothetical protein
MTLLTEQQPQIPAELLAFRWACGYAEVMPGVRLCTVQLRQGSLQVAFNSTPEDLLRMAADLETTAKQAASGIVPASTIPPLPNGQAGR